MSLCFFGSSSCPFPRCSLNFASVYDVIAHIEDVHAKDDVHLEGEASRCVKPSSVYRLFPNGKRPIPVPKTHTKLSFEYYRKRTSTMSSSLSMNRMPVRMSESERTDDGEEEGGGMGEGNGDERKYKCHVEGCDKRYKNLQGVKYHMRNTHGKGEGGGGDNATLTATTGSILSSSLLTPSMPLPSSTSMGIPTENSLIPASPSTTSAPPTPTKFAMQRPHKCSQCSKRYKTTVGLQNHVIQAHQKPRVDGVEPEKREKGLSMTVQDVASNSAVTKSVQEILNRAREVQAQEQQALAVSSHSTISSSSSALYSNPPQAIRPVSAVSTGVQQTQQSYYSHGQSMQQHMAQRNVSGLPPIGDSSNRPPLQQTVISPQRRMRPPIAIHRNEESSQEWVLQQQQSDIPPTSTVRLLPPQHLIPSSQGVNTSTMAPPNYVPPSQYTQHYSQQQSYPVQQSYPPQGYNQGGYGGGGPPQYANTQQGAYPQSNTQGYTQYQGYTTNYGGPPQGYQQPYPPPQQQQPPQGSYPVQPAPGSYAVPPNQGGYPQPNPPYSQYATDAYGNQQQSQPQRMDQHDYTR